MMGKRIRMFFWLLTAACFGYNFYLWGGIYATPHIGSELITEVRESPLAATYMIIGEKAVGTVGARDGAIAHAASKFPELMATLLPDEINKLSVSRFLDAQSAPGSLTHYGALLLLALSFVLHWTRQKGVRSLGSGG
jgi:hypothetical protein